jgi:hypothetical protein
MDVYNGYQVYEIRYGNRPILINPPNNIVIPPSLPSKKIVPFKPVAKYDVCLVCDSSQPNKVTGVCEHCSSIRSVFSRMLEKQSKNLVKSKTNVFDVFYDCCVDCGDKAVVFQRHQLFASCRKCWKLMIKTAKPPKMPAKPTVLKKKYDRCLQCWLILTNLSSMHCGYCIDCRKQKDYLLITTKQGLKHIEPPKEKLYLNVIPEPPKMPAKPKTLVFKNKYRVCRLCYVNLNFPDSKHYGICQICRSNDDYLYKIKQNLKHFASIPPPPKMPAKPKPKTQVFKNKYDDCQLCYVNLDFPDSKHYGFCRDCRSCYKYLSKIKKDLKHVNPPKEKLYLDVIPQPPKMPAKPKAFDFKNKYITCQCCNSGISLPQSCHYGICRECRILKDKWLVYTKKNLKHVELPKEKLYLDAQPPKMTATCQWCTCDIDFLKGYDGFCRKCRDQKYNHLFYTKKHVEPSKEIPQPKKALYKVQLICLQKPAQLSSYWENNAVSFTIQSVDEPSVYMPDVIAQIGDEQLKTTLTGEIERYGPAIVMSVVQVKEYTLYARDKNGFSSAYFTATVPPSFRPELQAWVEEGNHPFTIENYEKMMQLQLQYEKIVKEEPLMEWVWPTFEACSLGNVDTPVPRVIKEQVLLSFQNLPKCPETDKWIETCKKLKTL